MAASSCESAHNTRYHAFFRHALFLLVRYKPCFLNISDDDSMMSHTCDKQFFQKSCAFAIFFGFIPTGEYFRVFFWEGWLLCFPACQKPG
jgi:hypothetical protein